MDAPPVIPSDAARRNRPTWWVFLGLGILAVACGVFYFFNPSQYSFYPRCGLYVTTGLYCPGCGAQRSVYELLHGNFREASRDNALLVICLPFVIAYSIRWVNCKIGGRPLPRFSPKPMWVIWFVMVMGVFAILRNIPHAPFIYLTPR